MRNIEIKVRITDPDRLAAILRDDLRARDAGVLEQRDVFLPSRSGRLKLRFQNDQRPQLIFYRRADEASLRVSNYEIIPIEDGEAFLDVADQAWGLGAQVHKTRRLFWLDNIRVHLDQVDGLGCFIEIEAMVDETHDEPACLEAAQRLLSALGLDPSEAESRAYVNLLER